MNRHNPLWAIRLRAEVNGAEVWRKQTFPMHARLARSVGVQLRDDELKLVARKADAVDAGLKFAVHVDFVAVEP